MIKRLAVVGIACAFLFGCQKTPDSMGLQGNEDTKFGSATLKLPKVSQLGLAKTSAITPVQFQLTISGPNMDTIYKSWDLRNSDTSIYIEKIPAGQMRIFTGSIISAYQGITHEGSDTVAILPGQTAYVNLYLRRSGSAQIQVTVEGLEEYPDMVGCYMVKGTIENVDISNKTIRFFEQRDSLVYGAITENGITVGKIYGSFSSNLSFRLTWSEPSRLYRIFGGVSQDGSYLKGIFTSFYDTSKTVGFLSGIKIQCDTIFPPPPPPSPCGAPIVIKEIPFGYKFTVGDTFNIAFCVDTTQISNIVIEFSPDGMNWGKVHDVTLPANIHHYGWVIPDSIWMGVAYNSTITSKGTIRISSYDGLYKAYSKPFAIQDGTTPVDSCQSYSLKINSPYYGQVFHVGESMSVEWCGTQVYAGNEAVFTVSIDGGKTFHEVLNYTVPLSNGVLNWIIPEFVNGMSIVSSNCIIKIQDYNSPAISALSGTFSIISGDTVVVPPKMLLGITYPIDGEVFAYHDTIRTSWISDTMLSGGFLLSASMDGKTWRIVDKMYKRDYSGSFATPASSIFNAFPMISAPKVSCYLKVFDSSNSSIEATTPNRITIVR